MERKELPAYAISLLSKAGAQKSQCALVDSERHALSFCNGKFSLFRTAQNTSLELVAIKDSRRGTFKTGPLGETEIPAAVDNMLCGLQSAPMDEAYDIAPAQPAGIFDNGISAPDRGKMFDRLSEFREYLSGNYRAITLRSANIEFVRESKDLRNSNGVCFSCAYGHYRINIETAVDEDGRSQAESSLYVVSKDIDRPVWTYGGIGAQVSQLDKLRHGQRLEGKFTGDIIVAPSAFRQFVKFFSVLSLRDLLLVPGTSPYKDKIGQKIADASFSLRSCPLSEEMSDGYFVTPDGFKAENSAIIELGVLKNFMLSYYGSKKLKVPHIPNGGGCYVVDPGSSGFEELLKSVHKGLLVAELCEDKPNERGDFSGVAKNSFYIEDGKIKFPVSNVLISGNIPSMLLNINGISRERVNFGNELYPWMSFGGVTVSGR